MSAFWSHLATVAPVDDCLIFNPVSTFCKEIPNEFFIRKCYSDMFQIILETVQVGITNDYEFETSGFAITGNPGIGKSIFLFYVMWRLRKMDNVKS